MKRGTTPTIRVSIGIKSEYISAITFLFKQECTEQCTTLVKKDYPSESVVYDETEKKFLVSFTEEETRTFREDDFLYMDTKVVLTNGKIPETKIVTLKMNRTLFAEESPND